jgi:hypothetical protein
MIHLTTVVSRKTPLDGRLEIPASLADRLLSAEMPLTISMQGERSAARLAEMACTCQKGAGAGHHHHFLESERLKALSPGANVALTVDIDSGLIGLHLEH